MTVIEWREDFETGNPAVDHEHREMVALLNEMLESIRASTPTDETLDFLGEVTARISAHFALEEAEMQRREYDEYADHKEDHERLLDDIHDIMDAYEDGVYADQMEVFSTRLQAWFVDHFKTKDARLHQVIGNG